MSKVCTDASHAHSDLTPYFAYQCVVAWARKNGRDLGKMTSQTFYGYASHGANGDKVPVISSYREVTERVDGSSAQGKWMLEGAAFCAWFEDFKAGRNPIAGRTAEFASLLAEYAS